MFAKTEIFHKKWTIFWGNFWLMDIDSNYTYVNENKPNLEWIPKISGGKFLNKIDEDLENIYSIITVIDCWFFFLWK